MSRQINQIKIFVSCPSDVEVEKQIIREICNNISRIYVDSRNIEIRVVDWKMDVFSEIPGDRPQSVINRQIGEYDIYIGILWKRFGNKQKNGLTPTEEEFEEALKRRKETGKPIIQFYFKCDEFSPQNAYEKQQTREVQKFKEKIRSKNIGFYTDFTGVMEFREKILGSVLYIIENYDLRSDMLPIQKVEQMPEIQKVEQMPEIQKVEQILEFLSEQYDVDTEMKRDFNVEGWDPIEQDLLEIMNETHISPDNLQKINALVKNIEDCAKNIESNTHLYKETWEKYMNLREKELEVREKWLDFDPVNKEEFLEESRLGEECLSLAKREEEYIGLSSKYTNEIIKLRRNRAKNILRLIQIISKIYKITPITEETLKANNLYRRDTEGHPRKAKSNEHKKLINHLSKILKKDRFWNIEKWEIRREDVSPIGIILESTEGISLNEQKLLQSYKDEIESKVFEIDILVGEYDSNKTLVDQHWEDFLSIESEMEREHSELNRLGDEEWEAFNNYMNSNSDPEYEEIHEEKKREEEKQEEVYEKKLDEFLDMADKDVKTLEIVGELTEKYNRLSGDLRQTILEALEFYTSLAHFDYQ